MTFGKRLQALRKEKFLTQRKLAEIFNIGHGTIAMWETDKTEADIQTIKKLADYFDTSIDYLLGKTDNKKQYNELTNSQKNLTAEATKRLINLGYGQDLELLNNLTDEQLKSFVPVFKQLQNDNKKSDE